MKRLMPSTLITFLQNNRNCLRADCFVIVLPTGTIIYTTSGQFDITVPSGTPGWPLGTTTFYSTAYGVWKRGAITSEASYKLNANTMALTCAAGFNTQYPGLPTSLLSGALNGLFDAANVTVYTAYMPVGSYGNVSVGVETKFVGTITKLLDVSRVRAEFECGDPMYLLAMKIPTRTFEPMCPWSVTDSNCTLDPGTVDINGYHKTQAFTAAGASTQWALTPVTAFAQPADYFAQGVVTCLTGGNAGLSVTVKKHASGVLTLMNPWILPVLPGDTFSVLVGCNHTLSTCNQKFGNQLNFGGTPFTPSASASL